jgi:hypothetical protein
MFASFLKPFRGVVSVAPFHNGEVVPAVAGVMRCFTPLTYGSHVLSTIKEGDAIWVGHELYSKKYFQKNSVTKVDRDKDRTRVYYGEYLLTLCREYPPKNSLDGLICVVLDEAELRRLIE